MPDVRTADGLVGTPLKEPKPKAVKPADMDRKCRSCGRWSRVTDRDPCPACQTPYGRLVIGLDKLHETPKIDPHVHEKPARKR